MRKKLTGFMCNTLFDVASPAAVLALVGVPLLLLIAAIVLVIVAVRLIRKAVRKNRAKREQGGPQA